MASTSATGQTYNDYNVIGDFLLTGYNKTPLLTVMGFLNGARRVASQEFAMSSNSSLDAGSQDVISENTSLSESTAKTYAKSQAYNVTQIMKQPYAVSDLREAATQQSADTVIEIGGLADTASEFDRQKALAMQQLKLNLEYSIIQGTYVGRSAVGTDVATGGLTDSTVGISTNTTSLSSAALSKDYIDDLLIDMADNGAPMDDLAIICKNTYLPQISEIYGFAPMDRMVGGLGIKQIVTDFGDLSVIGTVQAPANTIIIADLAYMQIAVLPHKGGIDLLDKEYMDGGSAQKGYLEGFLGIDFGHESYHGSLTSVA